MKIYFISALTVLILGIGLVYGVINYLPQFVGTQSNQHAFIDQLENNGILEFNSQKFDVEPLNGENIVFDNAFIKSNSTEKITILSFWASWCSPCVEEFPSMIELVNHFKGQVQIVAVSEDYNQEDMKIFIKGFPQFNPNHFYVLRDKAQAIMKLYQVQKMPEAFIFNSKGKLLRKVSGSIKWSEPEAISFFNKYLNATAAENTNKE